VQTGAADAFEHLRVGHLLGIGRNGHPALEEVEGKVLLPTDARADLLFERLDLAAAAQASDSERAFAHGVITSLGRADGR
jgi:hypothetical protein